MTIGNPAICIGLYLTGVHFRGELQYFRHVGVKKSSVDHSELEKQVTSDYKKNYVKLNKKILLYAVRIFPLF